MALNQFGMHHKILAIFCFAVFCIFNSFGEVVDVTQPPYNAVRGNSPNTVNDTAFQTAINDCISSGNQLYVPKGTYVFPNNTRLLINGTLDLKCENLAKFYFNNDYSNVAILIKSTGDPLNLSSLKFGQIVNQNTANSGSNGYGVKLENCAAVDLHVKYLHGWLAGVYLYAEASETTRENIIDLQTVDYCFWGVLLKAYGACTVAANTITWSVIGLSPNPIGLYASNGGSISYNIFEGASIWLERGSGNAIYGNADAIYLIYGNHFKIPLITVGSGGSGALIYGNYNGYQFNGNKNYFNVGLVPNFGWQIDTTKNIVVNNLQ